MSMLKRFFLTIAFLNLALASARVAADRPNVVWIVSEDNSIHYLDHFFEGGAKTPNITSLANHGLTYDHAFSNAPVCSVARTTLMTSCYGPRIGTQFHRKYKSVPLPTGLRMFPHYLQNAGYYTTNNSKTDYNAMVPLSVVWNESSRNATWRKRKDSSQPFFHMESHGSSHESSLHFNQQTFENEKTSHDPAKVKLADYFPDTPKFRYTHARYLDRIQSIDDIVGRTVAKLKEDGLLEDTFVFYFGDHGGVLPRSKGYVYESGLHVPLVVRVPENFKHLVDAELGDHVKGFVDFIDFGPTVLQLAGVEIPAEVDGRPFLGKDISMMKVNTRDESFGYADRFDEKYDLVRSLRKGKFHYIRNYQPYLPDGLINNYRYKMLAFAEWRDLFEAGNLKGPQLQFFQAKPVEMLFDVEADPHEVNNLAGDKQHAAKLLEMRERLKAKLVSIHDLSFYAESDLIKRAFENPKGFGQKLNGEINQLIEVAELAVHPYEKIKPQLKATLSSLNAAVRMWGAMVCTTFGKEAAELSDAAKPLLKDPQEIVRIRAAEFLGRIGEINPQTILTQVVNETQDPVIATEALNSVVWFRDFFGDRYSVKRSDFHPIAKGADVDDRLNYINGVPYPPKRKKPAKKKP